MPELRLALKETNIIIAVCNPAATNALHSACGSKRLRFQFGEETYRLHRVVVCARKGIYLFFFSFGSTLRALRGFDRLAEKAIVKS